MPRFSPLLLLGVFLVLASISCASAAELGIGTARIDAVGNTATVPITLDEVPQGLSGYELTVHLANPAVAEIVAVDFPSWASVHGTSDLPKDRVSMRAVDLSEQVGPSETSIPLATLTLKGISAGSTTLGITVNQMDDDEGNIVALTPPEVAVVVGSTSNGGGGSGGGGGDTPGDSGGGSGGSAGGSGGSAAPAAVSGAYAGSSASSNVPQEPTLAGGQAAGNNNGQPAEGQQESDGASVSGAAAPLPVGETDGGISAYILPLGLLLTAAVIVGIFALARKRGR